MPVVKFQGDSISFPDNMSGNEISDVLGAMIAATKATGEFILTIGSGALAEPVAGLYGLTQALDGNPDSQPGAGANAVRSVQEKMTYQPRTEAGRRAMSRIGEDIRYMANYTGLEHVSGYWRDRVVPALQEQAGPIVGSALAAVGLGALAAVTEMTPGGRMGSAGRRMAPNQEGAIKAFHGSPHDFDKFSTDQIGTGEGAQAYGHGLYFAESEDVARGYRDAYDVKMVDRDGLEIDVTDTWEEMAAEIMDGRDYDEAVESVKLSGLEGNDEKLVLDVLDEWKDAGAHAEAPHMYQVGIDADPDDLLDWDKPLSEQSEGVKERLVGMYHSIGEADVDIDEINLMDDMEFSGRGLVDNLSIEKYNQMMDAKNGGKPVRNVAGTKQEVLFHDRWMDESGSPMDQKLWGDAKEVGHSDILNKAGIKGIKYKDGFSRGAEGGTSNFVIFDDSLISISKKYGIAIPAAAALLSEQTGQDPNSMYTTD